MRLIYWSHSYRPEDERVNRFFTRLFDREGLRVSFDPPSPSVNAAKLQRHLNGSDAMVAVLTRRQGGPSPYILFEIELCVRSRKPLLVFVEDELPDDLIPGRVLQRRFSRGSYFRQIREHTHAIEILKTYLGDEPPPRYQPAVTQRSCVIAGDGALRDDARESLLAMLVGRGFRVVRTSLLDENELETVEAIAQSQAALAFIDAGESVAQFARGLLHGASVPMVELTRNPLFSYRETVPRDLQPVMLPPVDDWAVLGPLVASHMDLLEENFVEGATGGELDAYLDELLDVGAGRGEYRDSDRERVVNNIMGDQYTIGQAGAVGPGSRAERMTFTQTWNQLSGELDVGRLAEELETLRQQLKAEATEPEHDVALGAIAEAEMAAKEGDGPKALEHLSVLKRIGGAGKWALGAATTIGTTVAAAALKIGLGL